MQTHFSVVRVEVFTPCELVMKVRAEKHISNQRNFNEIDPNEDSESCSFDILLGLHVIQWDC